MKFLFFDTETTGTDPVKNGMIQIAGLVVIDGKVEEKFNLNCNIHPDDVIEQKALDTNGATREQIAEYPDPAGVYQSLKAMFDKYINKFDKEDKFFAAGQNVKFDIEFLHSHFKKHGTPHPKQGCDGDPFLFSYIHAATFDTLNLAMMYELKKGIRIFKSYKLEHLCEMMDVKLDNAHDALADIEATRQLAQKLWRGIARGKCDGKRV